MDFQWKGVESTKNHLATVASIAASAMLARTILNEYLPNELRVFVSSGFFDKLFSRFSTEITIVIQENEGLTSNELYEASRNYLRTRLSPTMVRKLRVSKTEEKNSITLSLDDGEEVVDFFQGVPFRWQFIVEREDQSRDDDTTISSVTRWYQLSFHRKYKDMAIDVYLPHVMERAKDIKAADRRLKLYMNNYNIWSSIDLHHPANFETLAMEAELKRTIMEDLGMFVKSKEYYKKIGKTWKRGYLLFGPPGTGKSSLIAAMANYLGFDIYDLDLKEVRHNIELKKLLTGMTNKSLLVIEDIDCSVDLQNRKVETAKKSKIYVEEITLSGLLNFVDGLWSACGEERIIVFTTNYMDRLDPSLLRPGRMDMHIHMGYCDPNSFRLLASNYHAIEEHTLFDEIEGLLKEVDATPAEVAEELMRSGDVDVALGGLIKLLSERKQGNGAKHSQETVAEHQKQKCSET